MSETMTLAVFWAWCVGSGLTLGLLLPLGRWILFLSALIAMMSFNLLIGSMVLS